ncbi:MAG TPA: GMC oxidoreductase [Geminicoccus sp.]|jgi:choline dehydrogenase-like flavoprotein|uniref:GMC oxidoreductase n=1 Tax=Geminicoccus sp. TaxID=2024832 RepID=UPI002E3067AD|nr:GMC oxidoreductase [Geminicoccus sp.]HEX2525485.1 GMC oxidoreductase [Geminicoccus sp.]
MIEDARGLSSATCIESDLCIIGGGPAGMAVALRFACTGVRVCLLECGGLHQERRSQELLHGEHGGQPGLPLHWTRQSRLGGTAGWWGGECRPLDDAQDLSPRPWLDHPGWPISATDLKPFEPEACAFCGLGFGPFESHDMLLAQRQSLPLDPERFSTCLFRYAAPKDLTRLHRPRLDKARNIRVLLHAAAIRLEVAPGSRTVDAVRFSSFQGLEHVLRARRVVLAAGGIENARLLLVSEDLGNDKIGRCFMDHLYLDDVATFAPSPAAPGLRAYARRTSVSDSTFKLALMPRAALLAAAGSSHCCIKLAAPIKRTRAMLAAIALRHGLSSGYLPEPSHRLLARMITTSPELISQIARSLRRAEDASNPVPAGLAVSMVLEQLPNPDSRVTLSRTVDALGRPQARLDWRLSDADRLGWSAILAALDGDLRREGLGRLNHLPRDATVFDRLRPACHHMGTTRMSARPETGVVDRNGRVHGVGNLLLPEARSSLRAVMPTRC